MGVYAPALSYIWKSVEEAGMDPKALFEEAGIDPNLRLDITARVRNDQVDDLLCIFKQNSRDDTFIFKLAQNIQPSYIGALGLAWLTSPSLRDAFERLHRHGRAVSDAQEIRIEDHGNEVRVIFDHGSIVFRDQALRQGLSMATAVQLCRMTYGDSFTPTGVHFQFPEPSSVNAYYEFFRCELFFDAEFDILVMPTEIADQPLPGFNPQLLQQMDMMVIDYLAELDKDDVIGRTRAEIIRQLPSGRVGLESVANALFISQRSLTRKLQERNESFKNLLATTRKELSEKYVQNKNLSLTEISFLLGFSETSSFSRAYKTWTGQSPSSYREATM